MNEELLEKARRFVISAHGKQKYGKKPYLYHLEAVASILKPYGPEAQIIGYLHDTIEDTCITSRDVEHQFGQFIKACVVILSDEDGMDRKERKRKTNKKMSRVTGKEVLALVVKAADRLANVEACIAARNHRLLEIYRGEQEEFHRAVYRSGLCNDIWKRIDAVITSPLEKPPAG